MPQAQLELRHEFDDDPQPLATPFAFAPTAKLATLTGREVDNDQFNVGLGLSALLPGGRSAYVSYERLMASKCLSQDPFRSACGGNSDHVATTTSLLHPRPAPGLKRKALAQLSCRTASCEPRPHGRGDMGRSHCRLGTSVGLQRGSISLSAARTGTATA